ncbi:MAG: hemophore-related protein [Planctomycetes bacterium]|nr:hemophore-related protein [Planctomycetota bacterium]MCB9870903.1 hypothetical protein [Planctomycetota bacterium]
MEPAHPAADSRIAVFLGAPPDVARRELGAILAEHPGARATVYLREACQKELEGTLAGCAVESDKPHGNKRAFLRGLRQPLYDVAYVLDFGHWSYWPNRCLWFLARARRRVVRTERGAFVWSSLRPWVLVRHWLYRRKHRSGAVAGMPPGTPAPFVVAAYRKTVGLLVGVVWMAVECTWRRIRIELR